MQGTTDDSGEVLFEGFDWSLGTGAVTCVRGKLAISTLDISEDEAPEGAIELFIPEPSSPLETVTLSGTTLNRVDDSHFIYLNPSVGPGSYQSNRANYELEVRRGVPFSLIAAEFEVVANPDPHGIAQDFFGWVVQPNAVLEADAVVDLDLASTVTPVTAAGTINLPPPATSAFTGPAAYSYFYVSPKDDDLYGSVLVGFPTRIAFSEDDTTVVYEAESVDTPYSDDELVTAFFVASSNSPTAELSYLLVPGLPKNGEGNEQFLNPAQVLEPSGAAVKLEGATVKWSPDGESATMLNVTDGAGASWFIRWVGDVSEITVPSLPTAAPVAELFTGSSFTGGLLVEGELLPDTNLYHKLAISRPLRFKP